MTHARRKPPGAQRRYGVLVGRVRAGFENPEGKSPHYELLVEADGGERFRLAVNVRSIDGSDILAFYDDAYAQPTKLDLARLAQTSGFWPLQTGPEGEGLDYLRDKLFPLDAMRQVPPDSDNGGFSLASLLDGAIKRAVEDDQTVAIAFGEYFRDSEPDEHFHFSPEQGLHDIHMMQGNQGPFASDDRVNGDGALFLRFAGGTETAALFVRFTTQALQTDDNTGAPL